MSPKCGPRQLPQAHCAIAARLACLLRSMARRARVAMQFRSSKSETQSRF